MRSRSACSRLARSIIQSTVHTTLERLGPVRSPIPIHAGGPWEQSQSRGSEVVDLGSSEFPKRRVADLGCSHRFQPCFQTNRREVFPGKISSEEVTSPRGETLGPSWCKFGDGASHQTKLARRITGKPTIAFRFCFYFCENPHVSSRFNCCRRAGTMGAGIALVSATSGLKSSNRRLRRALGKARPYAKTLVEMSKKNG